MHATYYIYTHILHCNKHHLNTFLSVKYPVVASVYTSTTQAFRHQLP